MDHRCPIPAGGLMINLGFRGRDHRCSMQTGGLMSNLGFRVEGQGPSLSYTGWRTYDQLGFRV